MNSRLCNIFGLIPVPGTEILKPFKLSKETLKVSLVNEVTFGKHSPIGAGGQENQPHG